MADENFVGQVRRIYTSNNEFIIDSKISGTDCYKCFYTNGKNKGKEHHFSHWFINCKTYCVTNRIENHGSDAGGEYIFYEPIDFDKCISCTHISDNEKECRFECDTEPCTYEKKIDFIEQE